MTKQEEDDIILQFFFYAREFHHIIPGITDCHQYVILHTSDDREIFIRRITEQLPENPLKAHFYTCSDWLLYKGEFVKSRLAHFFGKSKKLHGRDCEAKRIDAQIASEFLSKNHLHGPLTGKYKYGLFHKKLGLVGVATFAQARNFSQDTKRIVSSEMLALSFLLGHSVTGGFHKLLQAHIRDRHPNEIMTYSDLDLGRHNIYKKSNFISRGITEPKHFTIDAKGNRIYSNKSSEENTQRIGFEYRNQGFEKWVLLVKS